MTICTVAAATAQTHYSYLPSAAVNDGRMFSIAGGNLNTLADNTLVFEIGVPAAATSFEIGIFDGETGGNWDQGTVPLEYTLYADPNGDATGATQVGIWHGDSMVNNGWYNITLNTAEAAHCNGANFFYTLKVRSTDPATFQWSSFKLRTSGTIVIRRNTSIAYTAPLGNGLDALNIYPNYPTLTPTTYDGSWHFFFQVPDVVKLSMVDIWDGDLDRGSYDCSDNDTDDPDTPNSIPTWATGPVVAEGTAVSSLPCQDASGNPTGGNTTSNPADDSRNPVFRRGPGVSYELISPGGTHYLNDNPSGNLEWEHFVLSTDAFDRNQMDYHVPSIERGIWELRVSGVDLSNLNAFRFPYDATGVDSNGVAIAPLSADFTNGTVTGLVYYENNGNNTQDANEPGIPSVSITLSCDFNNDGIVDTTLTTETNSSGQFTFTGLSKGTYTITVETSTLVPGTTPVWDSDSTATVNIVGCTLTSCSHTASATFAYQTPAPPVGTRTRGYWVNHPDDWPVSSLTLGGRSYTKAELLDILKRPTRGDQTYSLSAQLIATKLNIQAGSISTCITQTVSDADSFLTLHPVGSQVKSDQTASSLTDTLDDYNNGRLCAQHMN
ncbi:MAG: hypothetical protein JST22_08285 [Bacteroidetes bacterium]|nr:hypothetical protein [Bacteroidota bacterium]